MKFGLFVYCTIGRRSELEQGMAGRKPELYQRMLEELARLAVFSEDRGYFSFGHPEHHLQIEGFQVSNNPTHYGNVHRSKQQKSRSNYLLFCFKHSQPFENRRSDLHHG